MYTVKALGKSQKPDELKQAELNVQKNLQMKDINMTNIFGQITKKQFLLPLGALIVGGSTILGFASQVLAVNVPAGPIWNNDDARRVCPAVCTAAGGTWDGNWTTVIEGESSVCSCN